MPTLETLRANLEAQYELVERQIAKVLSNEFDTLTDEGSVFQQKQLKALREDRSTILAELAALSPQASDSALGQQLLGTFSRCPT